MVEQTQEQELIEQLSSDKRSLRIQAVVKLTRIGKSEAALKSLASLMATGDREEVFFITQAISKISQKLKIDPSSIVSNKTKVPVQDSTLPDNQEQNKEQHIWTSEDFLQAKNENTPALLEVIRNKPNEIPEEVLPSVAVFLSKYGDKKDSNFIQTYLNHFEGNLLLPFISAAEKIDSKILIPVLPDLLASKEALVRSRAVMVLRKIDPDEAERHFLNLLSSEQAENRIAALEIGFLFPFEHVKDYVLNLLNHHKNDCLFC